MSKDETKFHAISTNHDTKGEKDPHPKFIFNQGYGLFGGLNLEYN
jgi:hypothetical protein